MAAKDLIHESVVLALQKDNWITKEPLYISVPGLGVEIDFGAEKIILAELSTSDLNTMGLTSQMLKSGLDSERVEL